MPHQDTVPELHEKKPKRGKKQQPKQHGLPLVMAELDKQLAAAVASLQGINAELHTIGGKIAMWENRLLRTKQQISELVSLQRELNGAGPVLTTSLASQVFTGGPISYDPQAPIPPGVSSIPTRQPKAGPGNTADVVSREGGFS